MTSRVGTVGVIFIFRNSRSLDLLDYERSTVFASCRFKVEGRQLVSDHLQLKYDTC